MGFLASHERSSIVSADFDRASAFGRYAVIFTAQAYFCRLESVFEIGTYGGDKHDNHVFVCRLNAYTSADTDFERTNIERCTSTVRGNKALVEFHNLTHHFAEELDRHRLHADTLGTADETLSVFLHTENPDFAVFTAECLKTFKTFLAIVQAGSRYVHGNIFRVGNFDFAPFAIFACAAYVAVSLHVGERQVRPIDFCLFH